MCATRTGQILNLSELAREVGVSSPTAARCVSLLETGYQVFLLYPFYRNIGKRLVKSPKLYFNDTALACYLLGFRDSATLLNSPHFPHLFETLLVTDFWKRFLHFGQLSSLYYLRTHDGFEVDLVIELAGRLHLFEVKSTSTIYPKHGASLVRARRDLGKLAASAFLISGGEQAFQLAPGVQCRGWRTVLAR